MTGPLTFGEVLARDGWFLLACMAAGVWQLAKWYGRLVARVLDWLERAP